MTTATKRGAAHIYGNSPLYPLYAERARPAAGLDLGKRCEQCQWKPRAGEKVADLPDGGGLVHARCAAQAANGGERPFHEILREAKRTGTCPVHGEGLVYDPDKEVQATGDCQEHVICPATGCRVGAWYG